MPITETIKINDDGISTLKKLQEEHQSFKKELKSTRQELKDTWDKKYKPAIDNSSALKSIKTIQTKAGTMKDSLDAKIRLDDSDINKLNTIRSKLNQIGKIAVSPLVKLKDSVSNRINTLYLHLLRVGDMVISPVVKLKDLALSKLKSSIKLFRQFGHMVASPLIRIRDNATSRLRTIISSLSILSKKVISPLIELKDNITSKIRIINNRLNAISKKVINPTVRLLVRITDYATSKIKSIRSNLLFLAKLSIQPIIKIHDLASSGISKIRSGLKTIGSVTYNAVLGIKDKATQSITRFKSLLSTLTKRAISPVVTLKDKITSKANTIRNELSRVGRIVAKPIVVLKDNVTNKLFPITNKLKTFGSKTWKATITAVNKTASGIAGAMKGLAGVAKKMIIPVTVAATVTTAAIGAAVNSGMQLENQQVSIEHFIGATNKNYGEEQIKKAAQSFTEQLRQNANATPFETGEVISAGSRAIAITQGNTKSAMSLVTLAEDMAAASGGTKSVSDAIEALADAKLGEMERLKEFGFKVSADEFNKKGFEGVSKDLSDFYGGAAQKLATTGSGLLSTITGKLKSGVADFGLKIVDQLKPVLTNIIGLVDKAMPYVEEFGSAFGESLGKGIQYIGSVMPSFISGFKQMMPTIQSLISGVQMMLPPIMAFGGTLVGTIQNIIVQATPVIDQIVQAIARILPAVQPIFSQIVTTVGNIVTTVLPPLGTAFSMIADVIVAIAPIVSDTFGVISECVTSAISGISGVIQGGLDLISSIWSGSWQGCVDSFGTIFGGIAEICKAPINAVISIINGAIDGINSISVDIPDWVPFAGGQHWGLDLGHIPMLAKGGVVNQATTAIVGESGKEAVMPLERNTGWIGQLANQIIGNMSGLQTSYAGGIPLMNGNNPTPNTVSKAMSVVINITKLADSIIVKEKEDIDEIAEEVADKILEVVENL